MDSFAIGIDLGTSTSEVAYFRNGEPHVLPDPLTKSAIVPSLISISSDGELLVGEEARGRVDLQGFGVREIKRLMGTGEVVRLGEHSYRPEEISALILRKLKQNAEGALGAPIEEAVISVPANFYDAARTATYNAAQIAGLNVLRLINEPTAAALAFGVKNASVEEQIVVFDFGGGTLDVTALEMIEGVLDVKSSVGDTQLGGKDFDAALISLLLDRYAMEGGEILDPESARRAVKQAAETAKIHLSNHESVYVLVPRLGRRRGEMFDLETEISRADFEQAIRPLLSRARQVVSDALLVKKLRPESIDRILLVGGTTYIPAVRNLVAELFGREGRTDVHPDLAVAMGAAVQAGIIGGLVPSESGILIADVSAKGFGIDVVTERYGEAVLIYDPLIEPNTPIPYSVRRDYTLLTPDQRSVSLTLFQDSTGKARRLEDAEETGICGIIDDIPPSQYGNPHPLVVDFNYNLDGRIVLKASIPGLNRSVEIQYAPSELRMSNEQVLNATARVEDLWTLSSKAKRYEPLLKKADMARSRTSSEETDRKLEEAVDKLKSAMADESETRMKAAAEELTDILFDIENGLV